MSIFCLYKFFCFYRAKFLQFSTGPVGKPAPESVLLFAPSHREFIALGADPDPDSDSDLDLADFDLDGVGREGRATPGSF